MDNQKITFTISFPRCETFLLHLLCIGCTSFSAMYCLIQKWPLQWHSYHNICYNHDIFKLGIFLAGGQESITKVTLPYFLNHILSTPNLNRTEYISIHTQIQCAFVCIGQRYTFFGPPLSSSLPSLSPVLVVSINIKIYYQIQKSLL